MKTTYTLFDELLAAPDKPMPESSRVHTANRIYLALLEIERGQEPSKDDWRALADVVNMMETLTTENGGWWAGFDGELVQIQDTSGLLQDASEAMAAAAARKNQGQQIRLDGQGIKAMRSVAEDYVMLLGALPHRVFVKCHRKTEKRIQEIQRGNAKPHDVVIVRL